MALDLGGQVISEKGGGGTAGGVIASPVTSMVASTSELVTSELVGAPRPPSAMPSRSGLLTEAVPSSVSVIVNEKGARRR